MTILYNIMKRIFKQREKERDEEVGFVYAKVKVKLCLLQI